ncbi:MAG: hypothetical protein JWN81_2490 [Solirubrobacterales bacterium]|jgi:hypothetical protein|nr:hypothetical protein [Solirubrobacterales bacterium]
MQKPTSPIPAVLPLERKQLAAPSPPKLPRTVLRARHLEAHAVAWLRSLRDRQPMRP